MDPQEIAQEENNVAPAGAEEAPVTPQETTVDPAPTATEGETPSASDDTPDSVQQRINEITRARRQAEREAERLDQENQFLRSRVGTTQETPAQPQVTGEPKYEDYETDKDYTEALVDWRLNQKLQEQESQRQMMAKQEREAVLKAKMIEDVRKNKAVYADFDDVVFFPTPDPYTRQDPHAQTRELILECDNPAAVAYELGKLGRGAHVDLLGKSLAAQSLTIAKLDAQISASKNPQTNRVSNAPEPIKPVGGAEVPPKNPEDMTQAEYNAWRDSVD